MTFDVRTFDVKQFDKILARGLSHGLGKRGGQVCIEAAICQVLGLEHGDDPGCVAATVRSYKICLNDSPWSSAEARAKGLRDLGLAQLGSKGAIDDIEFNRKLTEKTIRVLIPKLFRQIFPKDAACLSAAGRCEVEGTSQAARAAAAAAPWAVEAAAAEAAEWAAAKWAAEAAAAAAAAARAARAAARAAAGAEARAEGDAYLNLSASLALEVLRELKSPGVALLG
jgi:hypothetical protein